MTHYPAEGTAIALLVLAHGAGAGQTHPFMVATARGLAARGVDVATFDFPYMTNPRRGAQPAGTPWRRSLPDRPPALEQSFRDIIAAARRWSTAGPLFIGGKSMGGRIATHLGAQGVDGLSGVIALGYPLHPPGRPEQLRVAHLPSIVVPVLIVQGERDAFGAPQELQPHLDTMQAPVTLHVVPGADHSLAVRGRAGTGVHDAVMDAIAAWVAAGVRALLSRRT